MLEHKRGDVVMLRSGGPRMTVEGKDDDGELTCVWFVKGKSKRDAFPSAALKPVDDASEPTP